MDLHVDGAYSSNTPDTVQYSYVLGCKKYNGSCPSNGSNQVQGELMAVVEGLREAYRQGYREVTVCFDYQGIRDWAIGAWKAKQPMTQQYVTIVKKAMEHMKIEFKYVGHFGNKAH